MLKVKINLFFFSLSLVVCVQQEEEEEEAAEEEKEKAEWVEGWKERRIEAVRGGGSKRVNPEQVNTAVDRHGLSGCLPPVAPVLRTGVPGSQQGPAKAAAEWAG